MDGREARITGIITANVSTERSTTTISSLMAARLSGSDVYISRTRTCIINTNVMEGADGRTTIKSEASNVSDRISAGSRRTAVTVERTISTGTTMVPYFS